MSMQTRAFRPIAPSQVVTTSATTTANRTTLAQIGTRAIRVVNTSTDNPIWIQFGDAVTTTATTTQSMQMLPSTVEVFTTPPDIAYVFVTSATTGVVVNITVGEGL